MSNLTDGTNLTGTISISKATGTKVTLDTDHKYLTKDIELTINVQEGSVTQNAPTINSSTGVVTATSTVTAGFVGTDTKSNTLSLSTQAAATITPTESEQTAVPSGKYTTGAVTVGAISSTYVGSGVTRNDEDDLYFDENGVTAPAGYYAEDATFDLDATVIEVIRL